MLAPLGSGITIVVHRRTASGRDSYGNDTWTEVDVSYDGCGFWPGSAGKNVAGTRESGEENLRSSVITRAQIMLPPDAQIDASDEVTTPDGARWQVSGEAQQWTSQLTGASTGLQVGIERTDG
jgi:hypothetical protein